MKLKLPLTLISLLVATTTLLVPLSVKGQEAAVSNPPKCVREPEAYIPPGTLAMMAYRGAFEEEGVPGYNVFVTEFNAGKVTAAKIVQAAVNGCVLSNKYGMAAQENYIADVKNQVQLFIQERD